MSTVKINTDEIKDETIAIWLSNLFKEGRDQALGVARNEEVFAIGADIDEYAEHMETVKLNKEYAAILDDAYNEVQKYWSVHKDQEV